MIRCACLCLTLSLDAAIGGARLVHRLVERLTVHSGEDLLR